MTTKLHVLCKGRGKPITVEITPGQQHETTMLEPLLDSVSIGGKRGRPRKRFETVAGDKAYDSAAAREAIRTRGSEPLIPHRKLQDGKYPARAAGFDRNQYKRRNVVERLIGRLKECRRIATRYDKLADSFRAFVLLGFIRVWGKNLLSYTAQGFGYPVCDRLMVRRRGPGFGYFGSAGDRGVTAGSRAADQL